MIQPIKPKANSQVDRAKQYPIINVIPNIKTNGAVFWALCPFHEDHNPSLAIYPKTNSFTCFSCRKSGDVIELYMKLHDLSFMEAVKRLT